MFSNKVTTCTYKIILPLLIDRIMSEVGHENVFFDYTRDIDKPRKGNHLGRNNHPLIYQTHLGM